MAITYKINCEEAGRKYPHYWEYCVGSCHAATLLREDVRNHIRNAHRDCGFTHVRCHGLFDDDMSVVFSPLNGPGPRTISFYNIDCIYDFLLDTGMKPFVEIGFMPTPLASGTQTCMNYRGNVTPPANYEEWDNLIRQFAQHLIDRYGIEEVQQWPFEVWNEPNLNFFFDGTQEDYFTLYEHTARALKSVNENLKVGGPATSVNAWIPEFKNYCSEHEVPLDFISTHHYPSDDPLSNMGMNGPGTKGKTVDEETMKMLAGMSPEQLQEMMAKFMAPKENKNPRDILFQMTKKAKEEAGELPLYYTEWNGSKEYDTSYQAAFILQTLAYNEGLVEGYSFWTVSDIFEEMGMKPGPFKNEFGIQTNHGIPKPSYRAFELLHLTGDRRLDAERAEKTDKQPETAEVLALKKDKEVMVFVYNHDLERRNIKAEEVTLKLTGKITSMKKTVIDEEHCNPLAAWEAMGEPAYLNREQEAVIRKASELVWEDCSIDGKALETEVTLTALPESVTTYLIEVE